jgi:predicted phosphodiesterase
MTHIGGYPGKYAPGIKTILYQEKPDLFISGHSHILKAMYDREIRIMHLNPGAAGIYGFHKVRTLMRFEIDGKKIQNLEVIELRGIR